MPGMKRAPARVNLGSVTRRTALASSVAALAAAQATRPAASKEIPSSLIAAHDKGVESILEKQQTDPKSKYRGGLADAYGLYAPGTAAGIVDTLTAAFVCKGSKYHRKGLLLDRIGMAVDFATRGLSADGNIYLPVTNFNSPPDTSFFVISYAAAAVYARKFGAPEVTAKLDPLMPRITDALVKGGIHTPNHRWVACAALAQLHELKPDPRLRRRIDQWLAEGIDINEDGQFSEQSVGGYSAICDRAFVVMAVKLGRPELFEPVRRNLNSLLYLLHPNNDVVTEVSVRQDRNSRVSAGIYWFPLKCMAVREGNGQYESLARQGSPWLGALLEYPELMEDVAPAPLPANYEKQFPSLGIARIRREATSATLHFKDNDRFLSFRRGDAVVQAVRFASAFFGKGQFIPKRCERKDGGYYFEQTLEGPYYQPLDKPAGRIVHHDEWVASRKLRKQTEVCALTQSAFLKEDAGGFSLRIRAEGTNEVPVAIEISLAPDGTLEGCEKLHDNVHILGTNGTGIYRKGKDAIRFGPGHKDSTYVDVRGALPRIEGTSVFLTGTTPFDHTLRFEWA